MVVSAGMPIFEAAVPCEVFGIGSSPVTLAAGFVLAESGTVDVLDRADTLIVPACANIHQQPPRALVDAVRAAYERGTRILSICSGAFLLAAAGVLDGRRATTHWMHADELARRLVTPPHRDGGQAQYHRLPPAKVGDDWLARLLDWATDNLHEPLTTADLATRAQVSVRSNEGSPPP